MFQRNLVDAYSKIIGVLKNINSKIKIGKRGANQNKQIKELQNSVRKLTENGKKAKIELEKVKQSKGTKSSKPTTSPTGTGTGQQPRGTGQQTTGTGTGTGPGQQTTPP